MRIAFILVLLILLLSYFAGSWLQHKPQTVQTNLTRSDCDLVSSACEVEQQGIHYRVEFSQTPSALTPFQVRLSVSQPAGWQPQAVSVSFSMPGMDMGFNTHQLQRIDDAWQAQVVLPVCTLSRNDWHLSVVLQADGADYQSEFVFIQP
jgi:hypothetical protein